MVSQLTDDQLADLIVNQQLPDEEFMAGTVRSRTKDWQYWQMCPETSGPFANRPCPTHTRNRGWIVLGPVNSPLTAVEYAQFQDVKHAQAFPQFGHGHSKEWSNPSTRFSNLIRNGGIHTFTLDQMVAYGWHRRPEIRAVRPELNDAIDVRCTYGCPNRVFSALSKDQAEQLYSRHVMVMHKETYQSESIGRELAKVAQTFSTSPGTRVSNEDLAQIVAAVMAAQQQMLKAPEINQAPVIDPDGNKK